MFNGGSGALYALLRNIVDSAAAKNMDGFVLNVSFVIALLNDISLKIRRDRCRESP